MALDTESEQLVQKSLEEMHHGKTAIIVAHRLWTSKHVDRILVLEEDRVVETGTHDELPARSGIYADRIKFQLELQRLNLCQNYVLLPSIVSLCPFWNKTLQTPMPTITNEHAKSAAIRSPIPIVYSTSPKQMNCRKSNQFFLISSLVGRSVAHF
jgi:ABC-type sulfate/molybdate transport systems ATPase subunit